MELKALSETENNIQSLLHKRKVFQRKISLTRLPNPSQFRYAIRIRSLSDLSLFFYRAEIKMCI